MTTVNSIRLRNLRCFDDTDFVRLRPITLLVGKNSAGKSTFARTFPLMRQSLEEETRSPVLWYGRLVDFGSFQTALNQRATDKEIEFGFGVELEGNTTLNRRSTYWGAPSIFPQPSTCQTTVTLRLRYAEQSGVTYASAIRICLFDNECELVFNDQNRLQSLRVNNFSWTPPDNTWALGHQQGVLPTIDYLRQVTRRTADGEEKSWRVHDPLHPILRAHLFEHLAHRNTNQETIDRLIHTLPIGSDDEIIEALRNSPHATTTIKEKASLLGTWQVRFKELRNLLYAAALPSLLNRLDQALSGYLKGIRYIEPLRATAQRYYRKQELAVDEIDPKGTNVAMFVDSLSRGEKESLNAWLFKHFGVRVIADNEGGHIALKLETENSPTKTNLADLGVGFSQLLPIVLQLWNASNQQSNRMRRTRYNDSPTIVIEQPELHLHPAYQARLGDVMVAALHKAKEENKQLTIIAETHSPHLVNRLGELISERVIPREFVQVLLFDDQDASKNKSPRISEFDSDGILLNWPFGFFEPEN